MNHITPKRKLNHYVEKNHLRRDRMIDGRLFLIMNRKITIRENHKSIILSFLYSLARSLGRIHPLHEFSSDL